MARARSGWIAGLALLVASVTGAGTGAAQAVAGTITGTVVDQSTGLTLAGAAVEIESLGLATITDNTGRFLLVRIPAGSHRLAVRYLGYGEEVRTVDVAGGSVTEMRVDLVADAIELSGVTVVGRRAGQAAALNQQLNALNITNVVASDQIGRFPDANVGDALKRIPGIVVTQDQGEARFGIIRGTEPRLNSITVNGERIPSAEAETRAIQLDLIPSDMVAAIEVNKVLTPAMDADAIGASVNLVTRAAPASPRASVTLGSGYNFLSEQPMGLASGVVAQRFAGGRLGVVLSGSYFDHRLGSDNIEGEWDGSAASPYLATLEVRRYDIDRTRRSVSASVDYAFSPTSVVRYQGIYNHRDDWENRYRLEYGLDEPGDDGVQETEVARQLKIGTPDQKYARLEDQRTQSHALFGEHVFGIADLDWSVQWARASEDRPHERYLEFEVEEVAGRADISDPRKPFVNLLDPGAAAPGNMEFKELTEEHQYTRDEDRNGRIDLRIPVGTGTQIQFGGRYRDKSKLRDNDFFEYEPLSGLESLADTETGDFTRDFLAGDKYRSGTFPTREYGAGLDLANGSLFAREAIPEEYLPGNFDATERIGGGYVQLQQEIGGGASILAGVRVENTQIDYTGYDYDVETEEASPTSGTDRYTNFFPAAILRWEPTPGRVFRAGWSNTIARPNYYDLVPYRIVNREDSELEIGNPDLDPTRSMNFDLMFEQYSQSIGLISAGVFYKDISDFIFGYTVRDAADPLTGAIFDELSQPANGADAHILGFETSIQRNLFGPIGVYANYTFTDSSIDGLPIEGRQNEELPLPGTSRHTGNASLSFTVPRFNIRASVNFQDDFLDPDGGIGDEAFFDRWYDRATSVDLNGEVVVRPGARIFFEANNLTNQPLRYYQGIRDRTMQAEYYNARFQAGLKMDLQ